MTTQFYDRLSNDFLKMQFDEINFNENHVKVLKLPNISVKAFSVYQWKFLLEKLENSVIFDLLIASNELELDELVEHLQSDFFNNNASWLKLNFAQVHRTSALISILKRDNLQLEESIICEYVIEWGKAKNPTLSANLDKWTSENFLSVKETLKECLPHIRYFSFSNKDVVEKIYPYQQLLEHQLFSDINVKFITLNRPISSIVLPLREILKTTLPTRIINIMTNGHALEISSWIDRKENPYIENNPYEFQLLIASGNYFIHSIHVNRIGSRNGFNVNTIFNICDKVSKTIIILKVEDTGEILGGPISSIVLPLREILKTTLPTRIINIMTNGHALEISSWIDRKENPYIENNPYEFQLLIASGNYFIHSIHVNRM
ncbi:hypothetical protein Glove_256g72 [Diversispora epigaea]|uniref:BACK domain-containing protein n=1 Tax=Diversispora epigaea TaxID=1348612 RepID=A0A397IER7_9GLOM|nr:hypothetical protein Glove_256g72 [Diversispora epigaea]